MEFEGSEKIMCQDKARKRSMARKRFSTRRASYRLYGAVKAYINSGKRRG